MQAALDLINCGMGLISRAFGTTAFSIEGFAKLFTGHWTDLGRTEVQQIASKRVTFSVLVEMSRAQFPDGIPPRVNKIVTRTSDGATFRITGEVQVDELTVRFALDSVHK